MGNLFDIENPNYDIFEVPVQEGGHFEDNYHGSIGDAVQKHLGQLSDAERWAWEGLCHMPDGNIFRIVPNWNQQDDDPFNLRGKELDKYFLELIEKGVSEETIKNVREAMEAEHERREQSEDIMDVGAAIPYHEWEKFPQMWNHYEIPATPRDRYMYVGNTRQAFYDLFPEDSPDKDTINIFLHMLNTDEAYDEDYMLNMNKWLKRRNCSSYTFEALNAVLKMVVMQNEDPATTLEKAIGYIDNERRKEYQGEAEKIAVKDGMLQLIRKNADDWEKKHKTGHHVFAEILEFGETLFRSFRNSMNKYHWHAYRRIRDKYVPSVIISNVDVNRCSIRELQEALNTTERAARDIWFARPFRNMAELYNSQLVTARNFSNSEETDKIVDWIEKCYNESLKSGNTACLKGAAERMTAAEKINKLGLQQEEWRKLWSFFNILKQSLLRALNAKKRNTNE